MSLLISDPGPLCTVQDLGRPGLSHLGVGRSGAADRGALIAANRAVGNADGAAGLEVTLGGLRLTAQTPILVALGGAAVDLVVNGVILAGPVNVAAGQHLRLGRPRNGLRSYLAVAGGIAVPPILGSCSTDLLAGIGPDVLRRGDLVPVGPLIGRPPTGSIEAAPAVSPPIDPDAGLPLLLGPRDEWFTDDAITTLFTATWTVGRDADRVGLHLQGPVLGRARTDELPTEGMVPGAVQVPPSGRPVVFLADAPVTGGYPVIGVLTAAGTNAAAQLRPGRPVRFRRVDPLEQQNLRWSHR